MSQLSVKDAEFVRAVRGAPIVYVASAFGGNPENQRLARLYCRLVVDMGRVPLAPHLLFPQFMSEETERIEARALALALLAVAGEVWVFGNITEGMNAEIRAAKLLEIPVRFFDVVCAPLGGEVG